MRQRLRQWPKRLKRETYALSLAMRDPRTPLYVRIFVGLVVAYAFSPIDLIPDVVPVLGYLDDLILVPLGVALALRLIPPPVLADCRARAAMLAEQRKPKSWLGLSMIVTAWIVAATLVLWFMLR